MNQQQIGRAGEHLTASYLCRYFDEIFECPPHARYKIQVKTSNSTFLKNNNDWVRWDIKKKVSNKNIRRIYDKEEVDIFAFCFLSLDKVIFIPNEKLGKTYQKKLEFVKGFDALPSLETAVEIINILREKENEPESKRFIQAVSAGS
jgi:hypothetical protein